MIEAAGLNLGTIYIEHRPIVYSECADVVTTPSEWIGVHWGAVASDVCARVDDITITPSAMDGGFYLFGSNATPSYPLGVEIPHQHEVWYGLVSTGGATTRLTRSSPYLSCYIGDYLAATEMRFISSLSSGTYEFKYRNVKHTTDNCTPNYLVSCEGHWKYKNVVLP